MFLFLALHSHLNFDFLLDKRHVDILVSLAYWVYFNYVCHLPSAMMSYPVNVNSLLIPPGSGF